MTFHMMTRSRTRLQNRNKIAKVMLDIGQRLVDTWKSQPNNIHEMEKIKNLEIMIAYKHSQLINGGEVDPAMFDIYYTSIVRTLKQTCINANVDVSDIPNYDLVKALMR